MICGYCNQAGCEEGLCRDTCECGKEKNPDSEFCRWCTAKWTRQANKWKNEAKKALNATK